MLIDEQNKIEKESIKKIKRNYSRTNLSLKQHLNKNKDIYSSFFENENSTYKMNKEKRNLSQPKERHKILNMKEEKNNIINDKKIEINNNLPKNLILPSEKTFLKSKEINQITSSDKIIGEKEEIKITINTDSAINVSENNNYQQTNSSTGKSNDYLSIISFGISIAIIVYTARIYKWTSKNPLENINLNNLNATINSSMTNIKNLKKNEFNESSFYDVSSSKEVKQYLRYLDEDCQDFNSELKKYNYQIDKVFNLKFDMVHKTSLGILIIICISFGASILLVISVFGALCCENKAFIILAPSLVIMTLVTLFSGITNTILLIILLVNYYKGNSTGDFLDFYEKCLDNDKKPYLMDAYNRLDKLNSNFTAFVVSNILGIILNTISSCREKKDDDQI